MLERVENKKEGEELYFDNLPWPEREPARLKYGEELNAQIDIVHPHFPKHGKTESVGDVLDQYDHTELISHYELSCLKEYLNKVRRENPDSPILERWMKENRFFYCKPGYYGSPLQVLRLSYNGWEFHMAGDSVRTRWKSSRTTRVVLIKKNGTAQPGE